MRCYVGVNTKIMKDYKKVDATCHIEVCCVCPYCGAFEDVFDDVREGKD